MSAVTTGIFDGVRPVQLALLHGDDFAHPDRFHHWQSRVQVARGKRLYLGSGAAVHHVGKTGVDGLIDLLTRRQHSNFQGCPVKRALMRVLLPGADRPASGAHHSHRTHQTLAVTVKQPLCRHRIQPGKRRTKGVAADLGQFIDTGGVNIVRHGWYDGNPVKCRLQIHACATDDDRHFASLSRRCYCDSRKIKPARHRCPFRCIQHPVEPVRDPRFILRIRAGCQNAQITIQLHGISIDDHPVKARRKRHGKCRFASSRRPGNHHIAAGGNGVLQVVSHQLLCFILWVTGNHNAAGHYATAGCFFNLGRWRHR